MTRKEAIKVIKVLFDNPLFSDLHRAAFNIAIHDIKARHDWDINNLILINKDNYEPLEQESILDKIRAKIAEHGSIRVGYVIAGRSDKDITQLVDGVLKQAKEQVIDIIDKYMAESEGKK